MAITESEVNEVRKALREAEKTTPLYWHKSKKPGKRIKKIINWIILIGIMLSVWSFGLLYLKALLS